MDDKKLKDALDEANYGLLEVVEQYQALGVRREKLQMLVDSIQAVLESESQLTSLPEPVNAATIPPAAAIPTVPLWMLAREVLQEAKRAMTVPDITTILTMRGHQVASDALRVAMLRRSDIFDKTGYGRYSLKAWRPAGEVDLPEDEGLEDLPEEIATPQLQGVDPSW